MGGSAEDSGAAAAHPRALGCRFAGVELSNPAAFAGSVPVEFGAVPESPCLASDLGAGAAPEASGAAAGSATTGVTSSVAGAGAAGCSLATPVAAATGTSAWVGSVVLVGLVEMVAADDGGALVAAADAVVSLLDGVELVCAPPQVCAIPERGSSLEVAVVDDETTEELMESLVGEEPVDGDGVDPGDDVLDPVSDEERFADEDGDFEEESDDGLAEPASGSASATPGVVASAAPTPSATTNAPTRPMYRALPIVVPVPVPVPVRRFAGC